MIFQFFGFLLLKKICLLHLIHSLNNCSTPICSLRYPKEETTDSLGLQWTAVLPNISQAPSFRPLLSPLGMMLIAIVFPEIIISTAWRQLRMAQRLRTRINEMRTEKKPKKPSGQLDIDVSYKMMRKNLRRYYPHSNSRAHLRTMLRYRHRKHWLLRVIQEAKMWQIHRMRRTTKSWTMSSLLGPLVKPFFCGDGRICHRERIN